MNHKIAIVVVVAFLLAGCDIRQAAAPVTPMHAAVRNTPAAGQSYVFAIAKSGQEVRWSPEAASTLSKTIVNGVVKPVAIAAAPNGEVFVANKGNDTVTGYASPLYAGSAPGKLVHTMKTLLPGGKAAAPIAAAVDGFSNVFVLLPYNIVDEFIPPNYHLARSFTFPGTLSSLIAGKNGDLAGAAGSAVWIYDYPHYTPQGININYTDTDPIALALDQKANLYVADATLHKIFIYARPYQGSPTKTFDYGVCCARRIRERLGDQRLFVSSSAYVYLIERDKKIVQYAPPDYTVITLIDEGRAPKSAALDAQGNLVVVNGSGGIGLYQLPAGTLLKTISSGTSFEAVATVP